MKLPLFYGRFPHFPHYFPHFPYIIGYARLAKLLYETLLFGCKLNIILNGKWTSFRWCGWHLKSDLIQDVRAWGWRAAIKSVARDIGQHHGVVDVPFICKENDTHPPMVFPWVSGHRFVNRDFSASGHIESPYPAFQYVHALSSGAFENVGLHSSHGRFLQKQNNTESHIQHCRREIPG